MARWLRIAALGGGAGTTTWLASASGFLLAVTCVLAVAAVVTASCAVHLHFHRRDEKTPAPAKPTESLTRGSSGFKFASKFPGRVLMNSSKKLLVSKRWGRKVEEDDAELKAYDRAAMEEGGGDSVWQRGILMGERCQPPDFSGIILYDVKGNRVPQLPPGSSELNIFHASLDQLDGAQQR